MRELDIETQLFDHISNLLCILVHYAEQEERYSFIYADQWEGVQVGDKKLRGYSAKSLQTLKQLGFIDIALEDQSNLKHPITSLYLLPSAFERARYENKNKFGKWWARFVHRMHKGFIVVFSLVAFILSLINTIKDVFS